MSGNGHGDAAIGGGDLLFYGTELERVEDVRVKTKAENTETAKRIKILEHRIHSEEKLRKEHEKNLSHAEKTMATHVQSKQESAARMGMDVTLYKSSEDQMTRECTPGLLQDQAQANHSAESNFAFLVKEVEEVHRSMVLQAKETRRLRQEAHALQQSIEDENLKEHVKKAEESTLEKKQMLESVQTRLAQIRGECRVVEERLRQAQGGKTDLHGRLVEDNEKTKQILATVTEKLQKELRDQDALKQRLRETESSSMSILEEIQRIKEIDSKLSDFIAQKEEKSKKESELRGERTTLETTKTNLGDSIKEAKKKKADADKSSESIKKKQEALEKEMNEKDALMVANRRPLEMKRDDAVKKHEEAKKALEEGGFVDLKTFGEEKNRLQELRNKRDKLRENFKDKQKRLNERNAAKVTQQQETGSLDTIRKAAQDTANKLKEEQERLQKLKERRKKRGELMKKLESLKNAKSRLEQTIKFENDFKAIQVL